MHTMIIHFYDTRSKFQYVNVAFLLNYVCVHMCTILLRMAEIWWKWQNDFKFNIIAWKGVGGLSSIVAIHYDIV